MERRQNGGSEVVTRTENDAAQNTWDLARFVQWVVQVAEGNTILHTPFLALTLETGKWLLTPAPKDPADRPDPAFTGEQVAHVLQAIGARAEHVAVHVAQANWQHWTVDVEARYAVGRARAAHAAAEVAFALANALDGMPVDWETCVRHVGFAFAEAKAFEVMSESEGTYPDNVDARDRFTAAYVQKFAAIAKQVSE